MPMYDEVRNEMHFTEEEEKELEAYEEAFKSIEFYLDDCQELGRQPDFEDFIAEYNYEDHKDLEKLFWEQADERIEDFR